ncbi:MAG: hypothetical protein GY696_24065 [Gammaproteobacteria bacterium]|nr:hypothetical protein [Gammaproteobacteria bacterium]
MDAETGVSLGHAWKARYLIPDADQIRFIPYSLRVSGREIHERAIQERRAIYVKLAVPEGKDPVLCESEASEIALLRRVQPTFPASYLPPIEEMVEKMRTLGHHRFGPMDLIPMEPVPGGDNLVICTHRKSPVRENMKAELCGSCKRRMLELARASAKSSSD